jgi:hypothetical protein
MPSIEVYAYRTPSATRALAAAQSPPSVPAPQESAPANEETGEPRRIRQAAAEEVKDAIL